MELLITMAIASVLLTMSYQGFGAMQTAENLKSSTQQVAFAIEKARYYATSKGVVTTIKFSKHAYSVKAGSQTLTNSSYIDAMSGTLGDVTVYSNTCGTLSFYVDGTPINSAGQPMSTDCVIKLSLGGGNKSINVQAGTGNVIYDK